MFKAKDVMTTPVISVTPDTTIDEVASRMLRHHVSGMPVVDLEGKIVGIVSEFDLLKLIYDPETTDCLVEKYMSNDVVTLDGEANIMEVVDTFLAKPVRRLPVTQNGKLVGMISRRDLIRVIRETRERINLHRWWTRSFSG